MNRPTSRHTQAKLMAAVSAFLVLGGGTAAVATSGGDRGPTAQIAKKKNRQAGTYRGTTEEGGTVSFRITRKRMVVGFTMPNVPVYCRMIQQGNPPPYPGTPFTITAPPMKLQVGPEGGPQFLYEDPIDTSGPHQGIHVDGKGAPGGMKGNASMISANGPAGEIGTTQCDTKFVDWSARKVDGKK
jgi:hypothetical protein